MLDDEEIYSASAFFVEKMMHKPKPQEIVTLDRDPTLLRFTNLGLTNLVEECQ